MWDDLKVFLAVARAGTTLGAAKELKVNQTTCARRITALEEALGAKLFERHVGGYRLLPLGERIRPMVEAMEHEARSVVQTVAGDAREAAKTVRLTTADGMAELFVGPALQLFRASHPNVQVELLVDNRQFDLTRGEADFAVRAGPAPTDPLLVARKMGPIPWAVYAGKGYAAAHGMPASLAEMADHSVVSFTYGQMVLENAVPEEAVQYKVNSAHGIAQTIAADLAVGGLPCLLGARQPNLVRCFDLSITTWIWLIYPERLRSEPHIRALSECLVQHFNTLRPLLLEGVGATRPEGSA